MEIFKESAVVMVAAPFCAAVILLEILLSNIKGRAVYSGRGVFENVGMTVLNILVDIVFRGVALVVLEFAFQHRVYEINPAFVYWGVLLLTEDFMYYWLHWVDHNCRLFWAVHVTHHSSEEFNLTVGFRSSVLQPLYRFLYFIPLALIGFKGIDIFLMYSATQLYGILIHTQLIGKLGWLEYVLVTPSHHRVHHGSNITYLDRNLGMVFIFWDKLFGTYTPETEDVRYGLTENVRDHSLFNIVFHEWRSIVNDSRKSPSLRDKFSYIFGPPGWSHDGSKKTSRQRRKELEIDA